jgi:hypothetical protein
MTRRLILLLVAGLACGSDSTGPGDTTVELQLVSVDSKAIPVQIYVDTNAEVGKVVGGRLSGDPTTTLCNFVLSLNRQRPNAVGGISDATGSASCTWTSSSNASASIDLGSPWGRHLYTFVK